jgi:manganese transport protein
MEGFLNLRMMPWLRRLVTRLLALGPAVVAIAMAGNEGIYRLLVLSQVILSLQLPFAVVPLIYLTSDKTKMGPFANSRPVKILAWLVASVILVLNGILVFDGLYPWLGTGAAWHWLAVVPVLALLVGLLGYLIVVPWIRRSQPWDTVLLTGSREVASRVQPLQVKRIGVAMEHAWGDAEILSAALAVARANHARLTLIHIVDAPGVMMLGKESSSRHAAADEAYLEELVREVEERELPVESMLLFGRPSDQIVKAVHEAGLDMLVMGSHGHQGMADYVHGQTVEAVRHRVRIPVLVVPSSTTEPA